MTTYVAAPCEQTAEAVEVLEATEVAPVGSADVPIAFEDDVAEALALLLRGGGLGTEMEMEMEMEMEVAAAPAISRIELEPLSLDLTPTPANTVLAKADTLELDGLEPNADTPDADAAAAAATEAPEAPVSEDGFEIPSSDGFTSAEPPAPVLAAVPDASDAHAVFVKALVEVAMGAGATRAAAIIPSLLDGTGGVHGLSPELGEGLVAARVLERTGDEMRPEKAFLATADAWRRVLREESSDLSACGASTLDTWGAELLAALGVGRDGRTDVRRELRKRGVAAFGMRVAA